MKNFKWWPVLGLVVVASAALTACGGGSNNNSNSSLRVVNLTLTHPSLDLLVNSSASVAGTALDTVSAYVGVGSGSSALQLNDSGKTTALAAISPTLAGGQHYALIAYEVSGAVKMAAMTEDLAVPLTGTAQLRVYDTATDAGPLDVYVTAPGVALSTVAPSFTINALTFGQTSALTPLTPGTIYEVRVTGQNVKSDLRADVQNVVLTNQQIGTVVLTPAVGGILLNGALLVQQGAYTAARNTTARVRLATGPMSGSPTVAAVAGTTTIDSGTVAPSVSSSYVTVPAAGPLSVSVNGTAQTVPVTALVAGSDNTVLVYGNPTSATVSVLTDDNHLPADPTKFKLRLVNMLTGTSAAALQLSANYANVAPTSTLPGTASAYGLITPTASMPLSVSSPSMYNTTVSLTANSVYSLFVLDTSTSGPSAPRLVLDR